MASFNSVSPCESRSASDSYSAEMNSIFVGRQKIKFSFRFSVKHSGSYFIFHDITGVKFHSE